MSTSPPPRPIAVTRITGPWEASVPRLSRPRGFHGSPHVCGFQQFLPAPFLCVVVRCTGRQARSWDPAAPGGLGPGGRAEGQRPPAEVPWPGQESEWPSPQPTCRDPAGMLGQGAAGGEMPGGLLPLPREGRVQSQRGAGESASST